MTSNRLHNFLTNAGWVVAAIAAVGAALIVIPMFIIGIMMLIGGMIGIMLIAWACGWPITVTKNGEKIGYYKRTTFHPYR
jgi:hypothetical protein